MEPLASFNWADCRVAIPGGTGLIGSYVTEELIKLGARVRVIDNLASGSMDHLSAVADKLDFHNADIAGAGMATSMFKGFDVVMNLAGVAPGLAPDQDWHDFLEQENLRIARAVLQGVMEAGVPRLLVVSSSCVYPVDAPVPTPEMELANTVPESVNHGYGQAKRTMEQESRAAAEGHPGLRIAIARPFNVFSGRDTRTGKGAHVIPSLIDRMLSDDSVVTVWGSGNQTRSFIHARDAARALIGLTGKYAEADPVNVGVSEEISMAELVARLMRIAGVRKTVHFDTTKPEGAARKAADVNRLRAILPDFQPEVSLDEGLKEMLASFSTRLSTRG